jgi:hypothetical protein
MTIGVPEGRHIVAHRFNGGVRCIIFLSPVGAAQGPLCRPYGA